MPEYLNTTFALLFAQSVGIHLVAYFSSLLSINLYKERVFSDEILENISDALVVVNPNGRLAFLNPTASQLLLLSGKDIGKLCDEVFDREGLRELKKLIADDTDINLDMDIEPYSGFILPVNVRVSMIGKTGHQMAGKIILIEDLTVKRRLQEIESRTRRLQEYSVISAGIAHEIRNPLASIKAAAEEIERDPTDPDIGKMAEILNKESDRLNSILTDFLHFTRLRSPTPDDVPLRRLVQEVEDSVLARSDKPYAYELDIDPDLKCFIDREQFVQVLLNLSLNSLQAAEQEVKITVSAKRENLRDFLTRHRPIQRGFSSFNREGIVITHEDEGPGISPEARENIFVPFFTTKSKGTGLGLAMIQRIIASHNGVIVPEFDRPRGVAFSIWIPLRSVWRNSGE